MASHDEASTNCQALGRGVTRSKRKVEQWIRKAAENGESKECIRLAQHMYADLPYAREVGHVVEAAGVVTPAGIMEGHDVPPDVLTSVIYWLRKGADNSLAMLDGLRKMSREGAKFCCNGGCEVVGHLKDFKVCPQCKTTRYWAPRVRNRTGLRVGTRRRAAQPNINILSAHDHA